MGKGEKQVSTYQKIFQTIVQSQTKSMVVFFPALKILLLIWMTEPDHVFSQMCMLPSEDASHSAGLCPRKAQSSVFALPLKHT